LYGFERDGGERLHSYHFNASTLDSDRVEIVEARASENLSKTRLYSSIEGGPLRLLGKDIIKYPAYFLTENSNYKYEVDEVLGEDQVWYYVISFESTVTTEKMFKTLSNGQVVWNKKNANLFEGQIWIDEESMAMTKISYQVMRNLKRFICAYRNNKVRHFDYKIDLEYKKVNGKYVINHIRQEDEFILRDTVQNFNVPFKAVSELTIKHSQSVSNSSSVERNDFPNTHLLELFNYADRYDQSFWVDYQNAFPESAIDSATYNALSVEKKLEEQFVDKVERNATLPSPVASRKTHQFEHLGKNYQDPYYWLKDTSNPKRNEAVMDYLELENAYTDNYFLPLKNAQRKIYHILRQRLSKSNNQKINKMGDYEYIQEFAEGEDFPVWKRRKPGSDSTTVLLDIPALVKEKNYLIVSVKGVNPENDIMIYKSITFWI